MAETLFARELQRAGLAENFAAESFGLAANSGEAASRGAQNAVRERGGDLSAHRSRGIGEIVPAENSVFIAMTPRHAQALKEFFSDVFAIGEFLPADAFPREIPDPFGGSENDYRAARDAIVSAFPQIVAFLKKLQSGEKS